MYAKYVCILKASVELNDNVCSIFSHFDEKRLSVNEHIYFSANYSHDIQHNNIVIFVCHCFCLHISLNSAIGICKFIALN